MCTNVSPTFGIVLILLVFGMIVPVGADASAPELSLTIEVNGDGVRAILRNDGKKEVKVNARLSIGAVGHATPIGLAVQNGDGERLKPKCRINVSTPRVRDVIALRPGESLEVLMGMDHFRKCFDLPSGRYSVVGVYNNRWLRYKADSGDYLEIPDVFRGPITSEKVDFEVE